jgi:hypothetical protein
MADHHPPFLLSRRLHIAAGGELMPSLQAGGAADVKGATHRLDRLALDIGCPPAMTLSERPGGDHAAVAESDLWTRTLALFAVSGR